MEKTEHANGLPEMIRRQGSESPGVAAFHIGIANIANRGICPIQLEDMAETTKPSGR